MLAINGVIGTWAGPDEPGTAYVMMHHTIGDVGDGQLGSWGYPIGGMGAVSDAIRRSAESFGATVLTDSPVASIDVLNGKVRGATTAAGRTFRAPIVVAATHPQITFLRQIDRAELPDDFVRDIERWRSRSGTVKVNVALSALPNFTAWPGDEPHEKYTGAIELCHSIDYVERAFQDAREGRAAARPFSDSVIPSTLDRTLCPDGTHVMSMFTQWVPESWSDEPHPAELEAYADRVIAGYDELAPGFARSVHPSSGDRALRDGARVRADRRQHLPRRAHARPALPHAPGTRLRRLHDADRRPVPVLVGDARRRRRDRHPGVAVHAADPVRPPPGAGCCGAPVGRAPPWVSRSIRR